MDELAARGRGRRRGWRCSRRRRCSGCRSRRLIAALERQPSWSDFPLLFLTSAGEEASATSTRLLQLFGPQANITLVERPVQVPTLLSSVRSALRARRRQYEVRDYLEERRTSDEKLLQTQKLESLGILAGGVAHDFNNLLTGILGNASLALDVLPPGSPTAAHAGGRGARQRARGAPHQAIAGVCGQGTVRAAGGGPLATRCGTSAI